MNRMARYAALLFTTAGLIAAPVAAQSALKNHDTQQAIDVRADDLQANNRTGRASFRGNVTVVQGSMTLKSDSLTLFYNTEKGSTNPEIDRLDAEGKVTLTSASESVAANWSVYDVTARTITFGGKVELKRGGNILRGDRLELDLVSGLARLDGNPADNGQVRGRFSVPNKDKN